MSDHDPSKDASQGQCFATNPNDRRNNAGDAALGISHVSFTLGTLIAAKDSYEQALAQRKNLVRPYATHRQHIWAAIALGIVGALSYIVSKIQKRSAISEKQQVIEAMPSIVETAAARHPAVKLLDEYLNAKDDETRQAVDRKWQEHLQLRHSDQESLMR